MFFKKSKSTTKKNWREFKVCFISPHVFCTFLKQAYCDQAYNFFFSFIEAMCAISTMTCYLVIAYCSLKMGLGFSHVWIGREGVGGAGSCIELNAEEKSVQFALLNNLIWMLILPSTPSFLLFFIPLSPFVLCKTLSMQYCNFKT